MTEQGNTPTTTKKPAARSATATRNRARSASATRGRSRTPNANVSQGGTTSPQSASSLQDDWRGFNRIVSRFLGKHPESSIDETTIDQVMQYGRTLRQQGQKTMTAGGGA